MVFDDKAHIAKVIKLARKKSGYTQEKLSELINISAKQLSRIETGEYIPSVPTFLKLINVLEIGMNEFGITYNKDENNNKEKFLKLIYQLDDDELQFYYDTICNIKKNLNTIK